MASFEVDDEAEYISGTDIKNWVYCPLIVYYRKVMVLDLKLGSQQEEGKRKHEDLQRKIMRRVGIALRKRLPEVKEKVMNQEIILQKERLRGLIDIVLITNNGEIIPVEIKMMRSNRGKPWPDHIYQLAYYAILLERKTGKLVKRGYIYYAEEEELIEIIITNHEKTRVKRIIRDIRRMLKDEKPPKIRINPRKCTGGCGYKWVCDKLGHNIA